MQTENGQSITPTSRGTISDGEDRVSSIEHTKTCLSRSVEKRPAIFDFQLDPVEFQQKSFHSRDPNALISRWPIASLHPELRTTMAVLMYQPISASIRNVLSRLGSYETLLTKTGAAIVFFSMTALLAISGSDASFRWAEVVLMEWLGITNNGLRQFLDCFGWDHVWNHLGQRISAICILYSLGLLATIFVIFQTVRKSTSRRVCLCVVIVSCWSALIVSRQAVNDVLMYRQAMSLLPQLETLCAELQRDWPIAQNQDSPIASNGDWPNASRLICPRTQILVPSKYPDTLYLPGASNSYPFREELGYCIERTSSGVIRFSLQCAWDSTVEFHPSGSRPSAYIDKFGHPSQAVISAKELKSGWFLVRYG